MNTAAAAAGIENLILNITQETRVLAPLDKTFAALLEQVGAGFENLEGKSMNMKIEAWPGGRWYRDLGDGNGHLWGHVQAIKRPTLLELSGPLFMSYAAINNVQYRLSEIEGGTLISLHHYCLGAIPADVREGVGKGWAHILEAIRQRAEGKRNN
jgi:activator of Hsp90 ATPase-like protein